jgi:hypothetical protein
MRVEYELTLSYGPDNDVWPVTLLDGALSFARIADAAVANLGPVTSGSSDGLTVLFLLAQSIELTLKAFLQPRGYDQTKLRSEIRHDRELADLYLVEAHRTLMCRIADPRDVPGLGIHPAADYGPISLMQFRAGAEGVPDLRELQK